MSMWSDEGEQQGVYTIGEDVTCQKLGSDHDRHTVEGHDLGGGGGGRAWQHDLPFKVEDNICSEPPLEVDTEVEPPTVSIQESRQTGRTS